LYDLTNTPPPPYWRPGLHEREGNILFADGHAEESYDAIFLSETTEAENLVYPDVKASTEFSPAGGTGGGTGGTPVQNSPRLPPVKADGTPVPPVIGHQEYSSKASAANSNSSNQPASPTLVDLSGRSVARNFTTASPTPNQSADAPQTNHAANVIHFATNTTAAMNDEAGMSNFDRRMVKIFQYVFGWGYLLLLLLFLLWLAFKIRREWRRWEQRRQQR